MQTTYDATFIPSDHRVAKVISVMRESFDKHHSVTLLASRVNLSAGRLHDLFKQETGTSPMRYLRLVRIKQAEKYLFETFLSIKEVAFRCGFGDVSHFVRDFKQQHGITPREFRASSFGIARRRSSNRDLIHDA